MFSSPADTLFHHNSHEQFNVFRKSQYYRANIAKKRVLIGFLTRPMLFFTFYVAQRVNQRRQPKNCMVNPRVNIDDTAKDIPERLLTLRPTGKDLSDTTGEIRECLC
jgi:hypothetical protein